MSTCTKQACESCFDENNRTSNTWTTSQCMCWNFELPDLGSQVKNKNDCPSYEKCCTRYSSCASCVSVVICYETRNAAKCVWDKNNGRCVDYATNGYPTNYASYSSACTVIQNTKNNNNGNTRSTRTYTSQATTSESNSSRRWYKRSNTGRARDHRGTYTKTPDAAPTEQPHDYGTGVEIAPPSYAQCIKAETGVNLYTNEGQEGDCD
eukprot:246013_1